MSRTIRNLDLPEIAILLDWAAAEGWNPGLDDAVAFHAADPTGFFGCFVDGIMVAGISAVAYDDDFGFIGLYICHPDWRGRGHGKAVWDAGIAYLGNRTIGLDGVPEQQANYASMGFVAAYETVRLHGVLEPRIGPGIQPASRLDEIVELDRQCFPADRTAFLQHWFGGPNRSAILRYNGRVSAYAVLRPCRDGSKIGPLFAEDATAALELLAAYSGAVYMDVPISQHAWLEALSAQGFTRGFRTQRRYRGPAPDIQQSSIFAITSLELG